MANLLNTTLSVMFWPVLLLQILFWIVALAGISSVQKACGGSASACGLRLFWWEIWFEIAILVVLTIVVIGGQALSRLRPAVLALLAYITVLLTLATDSFLSDRRGSNIDKRFNTAVAGFLMLTLLNMLLIIIIGTYEIGAAALGHDNMFQMVRRRPADGGAAPTKAGAAPAVHAGTGPHANYPAASQAVPPPGGATYPSAPGQPMGTSVV